MKKNLILMLWAVVALAAAPALKAQDAHAVHASDLPAWSENVGGQLAHLLASPSSATQERGLDLALHLINRHDLDLSPAAQPLLAIYRTSNDESARLAALSILVTIGDEEAMQDVRRYVSQQESCRVRVATLGALASYYGIGTFYRDAEAADLAAGLRGQIAYAAR